MDYINKVEVGGITYNIQDVRLDNPVDFKGVVSQNGSTATQTVITADAGETDQWKVGTIMSAGAWLTAASNSSSATINFGDSGTGTRIYTGDLVYAYQSGSVWNWQVVPSADNPHTHSIPVLSGTAASIASHSHTYNVPTQASASGAHSHEFALPELTGNVVASKNTQSAGSATSTFTGTSADTDSQGGHTHTVTMNSHRHSVTATGTISTTPSHSHKITYSKASASGTSIPATVSGNTLVFSVSYVTGITNTATEVTSTANGDHSHTFSGTAVNTEYVTSTVKSITSEGSHSHSVTASGSVSTTITWPQYVGTATIQAVSNLTTEGVPDHTHSLSGTSAAKNTGEAGGHSHSVSTTASTTGTGQ